MPLPESFDKKTRKFYDFIGQKIREFRQKNNLTQENFGKMVGFTKGTVTNIERGKQRIFIDQLFNWAQLLGLETGDLLPCKRSFSQLANEIRKDRSQGIIPQTVEESLIGYLKKKAMHD